MESKKDLLLDEHSDEIMTTFSDDEFMTYDYIYMVKHQNLITYYLNASDTHTYLELNNTKVR